MAFSQTDLDALEEAIASGALKVKYADREVTYQATGDMLKARLVMRNQLGQVSSAASHHVASFSKGL